APSRIARILKSREGLFLPFHCGAASEIDGCVDIWIGSRHVLETFFVDDQVWPQRIQQYIQVIVAKLYRGGGKEKNCFRVIAEESYGPMSIGFRIENVLGFVNNDQVK